MASTGFNYVIAAQSIINQHGLATSSGMILRFCEKTHSMEVIGTEDVKRLVRISYPESVGFVVDELTKVIISELYGGEYEIIREDRYIAFNNCIFDLELKKTIEYSSALAGRIFSYIPCDFDQSVTSDLVDKTFYEWACGDPEIVNLLFEMIGYILHGNPKLQKYFILVGPKDSGKSTFIKLLTHILTPKYVSAMPIDEFGTRFSLSQLPGKKINISPDIPGIKVGPKAASVIRSIVSHEQVTIEQKYFPSYSGCIPIVLVGGCNELPEFADKFGAMADRLIPICFSNHFDAGKNDIPDFDIVLAKDKDAITYIVSKSVQALIRLMERKEFTCPQSTTYQLEEFDLNNNNELAYVQDFDCDHFIDKSTDEIYEEYDAYCTQSNDSVVSKKDLKDTICTRYSLCVERVTVAGHKRRVYRPCKQTTSSSQIHAPITNTPTSTNTLVQEPSIPFISIN